MEAASQKDDDDDVKRDSEDVSIAWEKVQERQVGKNKDRKKTKLHFP